MVYIIGVPLMALMALIQSTMLSQFRFLSGRPDLILLVVIGWGLAGRSTESMVFAFFGGLFLDFFSALPFGTHAIALVLVALLVSLYERRIWEANILIPLGITLMGSLVYHMIILAVLLLSGRQIDLTFAFGRVILPSTFLNIILAIPMAQAMAGIARRLYPAEVDL
jgi:rod shape-determining protein MreD